jgi:hypothetical protein
LRVARLAAAGRTNREIAQALFITTKTASAHLSRVYRKLDITRRDQLAQALAGTAPDAARADSGADAGLEPDAAAAPGPGSSRISSGADRKRQG